MTVEMRGIKLADVQVLVGCGKIVWTEHVILRLRERKLKRKDVLECIANGEIVEHYKDDKPFPSCLISGRALDGRPMHVVCGVNSGIVCCIITSYCPATDKWESDYKTRKAVN